MSEIFPSRNGHGGASPASNGSRHGSSNGSALRKARCVVWSAGEPPKALLKAMARKGVEPCITHDAFRAMAEVVTSGSLNQKGAFLVLVEPSELRGKRSMLSACRKYAAGLRIWVFQAAAPMPLRPLQLSALVPEPKADTRHEDEYVQPQAAPLGESVVVPALRLVDSGSSVAGGSISGASAAGVTFSGASFAGGSISHGSLAGGSLAGQSQAGGGSDNSRAGSPGGLLSDEELAMLLADDTPGDRS